MSRRVRTDRLFEKTRLRTEVKTPMRKDILVFVSSAFATRSVSVESPFSLISLFKKIFPFFSSSIKYFFPLNVV